MSDLSTTPVDRRIYPIVRERGDHRFTFNLMFDIASVLERHGYPMPSGSDCLELQHALSVFLYGPTTPLASEYDSLYATACGLIAGIKSDDPNGACDLRDQLDWCAEAELTEERCRRLRELIGNIVTVSPLVTR